MLHSRRAKACTVERFFSAPPALVFAAWADPSAKALWFGALRGVSADTEAVDFCVGGQERLVARCGAATVRYDIVYRSIVPGQSIVFECQSYEPDGFAASSIVSVNLRAEGDGTRLTLREELIYLSAQSTERPRAAAGSC